jgi:hypothetical protein
MSGKFGQNFELSKSRQNLAKIRRKLAKRTAIFNKIFELRERCKGFQSGAKESIV